MGDIIIGISLEIHEPLTMIKIAKHLNREVVNEKF